MIFILFLVMQLKPLILDINGVQQRISSVQYEYNIDDTNNYVIIVTDSIFADGFEQ